MHEEHDNLALLKGRLLRFGRFRRNWVVLDGAAKFVLFAVGSLLFWFGLDCLVPLPAWLLLLLFAAVCGASLWAAGRYLLLRLFKRIRIAAEARLIESLHGQLDNGLIGALQLGSEVEDAAAAGRSVGYSPLLVRELLARTTRFLEQNDIRQLLDRSMTRRLLGAAGAVAVAAALCLTLAYGAVVERAARLRDAYATVLDSLFPVTLRVSPGDIAVVRGRPVTLGVDAAGARRRAIRLVRTDLETAAAVITPLELAERKASFVVPHADASFAYKFEYAGRYSPEHRVLVDDLPDVKSINYEMTPPKYTGQPMRMLTGRITKLQGLSGTTVFVSLAANTLLHPELCCVEWQNGQKQRLDISGRFGSFAFAMTRPERATLRLIGQHGPAFAMERPLTLEIALVPDKTPTVQPLVAKKEDMTMTPDEAASVSVPWLAQDDFGVSKVDLTYEVNTISELLGRGKRDGAFTQEVDPPRDRVKGKFDALFKGLQPPLAPGDKIKIVLSAADNNVETGPGLGRSDPFEILLVGSKLGEFAEAEFGLGRRRESALLLSQLERVKRETDLLQDPIKTDRTENPVAVAKQTLEANASQKTMLGESEDDVGRYFELLSGGK